jgi:hypothetical protein
MAQLYSRTLGSLYVASYDSQGYGGSIITRLDTWLSAAPEFNFGLYYAVRESNILP